LNFAQEPIFQWLSQYAFQPNLIYSALIGMMLLSSVGFPIPEEVTLISVGIIAYMGSHPDLFPPPYVGAPVVDPKNAAIVAFLTVVVCDTLIYLIGRFFGRKVLNLEPVQKFISPAVMVKVETWTQKYGAWACGIFRFTPGVRFPGHLACGILGFPLWKFIIIDGLAAAISVPTQIYLIAVYGESILATLKEVKVAILGMALVVGGYYLVKYLRQRHRNKLST